MHNTRIGKVLLFPVPLHYNQEKFQEKKLFCTRTPIRSCMKSAAKNSAMKSRKNHELRNHFDFSNLPACHPLYTNGNLWVTLKFKDGFAGEIIQEYVGLKPKLYSNISSSKFLFFKFSNYNFRKEQQKQIIRLCNWGEGEVFMWKTEITVNDLK